MQLTMLGVGSSGGTPMIGCACTTCTSSHPRNQRTRCSSLITLATGQHILIDTGPDLRQQALREKLTHVDAVLYTHTHADHLHGIDDLRGFCQRQRAQIPLYGSTTTCKHIAEKFGYALREPSDFWDLPVLKTHAVETPFSLFGQTITPIPIKHGHSDIYGYRISDFAYLTDVSAIPETSMSLLRGLKVLLLDCLRPTPHFTHINVEQSLRYASLIGAATTYLIHMTHELEYCALSAQLPNNVLVGYDGLKISLV
ncbi:MAG TPA: MBL fold metallo-hydrolase [Methylotenera sp.]|nr:MBL fold metallo-hydrolase [Methylotenera sp.]HPH04446.1 MBL fold metallo-hydrolase [Methylotenera sp.]HPN01540.1 MBL fold metallo-hydrolase [Methylotenera sp.]